MPALLESLYLIGLIAAGTVLAVIAGRRRSRLPVALGMTAVPGLGFLVAQMFC